MGTEWTDGQGQIYRDLNLGMHGKASNEVRVWQCVTEEDIRKIALFLGSRHRRLTLVGAPKSGYPDERYSRWASIAWVSLRIAPDRNCAVNLIHVPEGSTLNVGRRRKNS